MKMISALAFLPIEGVVAGFELRETLFAGDEQALCAYVEAS